MIDIFERIEAAIQHGREYRGQKVFKWELPRMVGATTWILKRTKEDLDQGCTVVLAGLGHLAEEIRRDPDLRVYQKHHYLYFFGEQTRVLHGKQVDRVYGDNVGYWPTRSIIEFNYGIIPCISQDGYSVFIDTTEG